MIITANPIFIRGDLQITNPIFLVCVFDDSLAMDFDKDGFDLNLFESTAYADNDIPLTHQINRLAYQHRWMNDPFKGKSGLRVDHSVVAARLEYAGEAKAQLEELAKERPLYNRYLQIKPKWGLDFNLEYIFEDGFTLELLHIEEDFSDYYKFLKRVVEIEKEICFYDSYDHVAQQMRALNNTGDRSAEQINDIKAHIFNFDKAYSTIKVI